MNRMRWSMAGRIALLAGAATLLALVTNYLVQRVTGMPTLAVAVALLVSLCCAFWGSRTVVRGWRDRIIAVTHGIGSLRDGDLSISITAGHDQEIDPLVLAYNGLGESLRRQRQDLHNRELLLDTVIQATPLALVLTNARDQIVFSNFAARSMLNNGRILEGLSLRDLLLQLPQSLRDAVDSRGDGLFTIETAGESEVFHITQRPFNLQAQPHQLLLLKPLTRELAAQEVAIWKKVIRVIAHELNNSLAPISSLAHSGSLLASRPDPEALARIFATIEERARHLAGFIDGYARFAKLPKPRPALNRWPALLEQLHGESRIRVHCPPHEQQGWFDASQMQQVVLNLVKNALESGSAADSVEVRVAAEGTGQRLSVSDRGSGFSVEALQNGLLPFFSTKDSGTGLGLTLCREIVEAHGGRLGLANRVDGGAVVSLWLPRPAGVTR